MRSPNNKFVEFNRYAFMPVLVSHLTALAFVLLVGSIAQTKEAQSQPNIVLIMADDLGWKDLNCYGNQKLDTPNLDRLALQGRLFTDAYSAAAVCTPTRAALMTGEAPGRLCITNHAGGHAEGFKLPGTDLITPAWTRHLPLDRVTLAEQLKAAGYATWRLPLWGTAELLRAI